MRLSRATQPVTLKARLGAVTRVRIRRVLFCVRFHVRFAFKPNRVSIIYLTLIKNYIPKLFKYFFK
jgi:hypothetical protein